MKKVLLALALIAGTMLVGGSPASAHTPTVSATCDGLSVNLVNYQYVAGKDGTKGSAAYDETVIDKAAYDETVAGKWWNWSPNKDQGPFNGPPVFPTDSRGTWEGPHTNGGPSKNLTGTFQQGGGHGSWFHREAATVIHHEAVTHVVHHPAVEGTPGTPEKINTVEVTVNGVVVDSQTFKTSFSKTYAFPQNGASSTWHVTVVSQDGIGNVNEGGTVGPCGEVVVPPKPKVEHRTNTDVNCTLRIVTEQDQVRTAVPVYNQESNTWEDGVFGDWVIDGPARTDEATNELCPPVVVVPPVVPPVVVPPVVTPPVVTPPVVTPPVVNPPVVTPPTTYTLAPTPPQQVAGYLPNTGSPALSWAILGGFMLLVGSALVYRCRPSKE